MKRFLVLLTGIVAFALVAGAAESAQKLLTEGQTAYMRGDLETAKKNFTLVTKLDPKNPTATGYLRVIAAAEARSPKTTASATQRELEKLIVPKVELKEATLESVLDYLKQTVKRLSGDKTSVSFVSKLSNEQLKSKTITLSLSDVPYTEVLRYVGDLADVEFVHEKYAIVVRPRATTATPTTAAPAPQ
jgi:hypothetical protein